MSLAEAGGSANTQDERKVSTVKGRTPEEAFAAREDRLKRLEEQAKWLMNKMNATNRRGSALSTRLEELHEVYGEPPVPPPMPDVLPSRRLRTALSDLPRQVRITTEVRVSFKVSFRRVTSSVGGACKSCWHLTECCINSFCSSFKSNRDVVNLIFMMYKFVQQQLLLFIDFLSVCNCLVFLKIDFNLIHRTN